MARLPRVVFAVSGHGYGHATRSALLLERLAAAVPVEAFVRSSAPARLFAGTGAALSAGDDEPPLLQRGGLEVDWEGSLRAHQQALARRPAAVAAEAAWLAGVRPDLVLSDASSLACEAAAKAGVPCRLFSNFTWDWVLGERAKADPRWLPVAGRLAEAYACAAGAWRLPGSGGFATVRSVEDAPLVARRSRLERAAARAALGVPADGKPLVLVSFGGFGATLPRLGAPGLDAYRFAGFGPKPAGLAAQWTELDASPASPHAEAVAACDAIVCKPGYGTFAEAAAHGARVLFVDRPDYAEAAALTGWLRGVAACRELPRGDFEEGRWAAHLDALLSRPAPPPVPAAGADAVAVRVRALLGQPNRSP
ncbi:MAG: hypothetical protein SF051_07595 [Elusimicrobiota bacterium]|nr:hypothetical protein [Elusimicrobiota bacterium]